MQSSLHGPDIGSTVRHARSRETCDSERWGGADSEWQLHYLLHSSLGDSLSILDRPFGKVLAAVSSDPRPEGYCNVFTRIAPNYGRALCSSPGKKGKSEAWTKEGWKGLCNSTSLLISSDDKWLVPQFTSHSDQVLNFLFIYFFLHISPPSPCCDRRLNWLSGAPGSDTTACCLLFVDYYWFSLILHLKINGRSRRKIGAVYTYFNILLCCGDGCSFLAAAVLAAANYEESS